MINASRAILYAIKIIKIDILLFKFLAYMAHPSAENLAQIGIK